MKFLFRPPAARIPVFLLFCTVCSSSAPLTSSGHPQEDYFDSSVPRFEDREYSPTIRTVQLFPAGMPTGRPVLRLGSGEDLELHFDDLGTTTEQLSYTLVHCDADWQPSDLMTGQYLEGAFSEFIQAPRLSYNTLQPFFHYTAEVPSAMMRPTRSGNYVLKVFRDGDENDLVITRRLMIYEPGVQIDARIQASRNVEERNSAQQVDLTLRYPELPVRDPFGELQVVILQNDRWDDRRTGLTPRFVRGNELIYDFPPEGLFPGINEWRNFNTNDLRFRHMRVADIKQGPRLTEVFLFPDEKRNIRVYLEQADINGRYFIDSELDDPFLSADYVNVHFTLPMDQPLADGDLYLYGGFSDLQCRKEYRMSWDAERHLYYLTVPLKQGFIDYAYAFLPKGSNVPDLTRLEGSHFQTENNYLILVYYNDPQQRSYRLVGMRALNSRGN